MNDTDALMKKCQIGDGRWPHAANDLLAECYGRLGWQQNRIRDLESVNADLYEALYNLMNRVKYDADSKHWWPYEQEQALAALAKARGEEPPR